MTLTWLINLYVIIGWIISNDVAGVSSTPILKKADCENGNFFTIDGFRKCSTVCDRKTKSFANEYDCTCCFNADGDNKASHGYEIGFFILLVLVVIFVVATARHVYLIKRSRKIQEPNRAMIQQNSANQESTALVFTDVLNPRLNQQETRV